MIPDIFSSFDQNIFFLDRKIWLLILIFPLFINSILWISLSSIKWLTISIFLFIYNQISLTLIKYIKRINFIITSLFIILLLLNLSGLIPYIFSISRHLIFSLTLRLPIWISLILSSFKINKKETIAHLLPSGAPEWLNPFLVIIETISILVRPLTLRFRLAANISAGHIILILIRTYLAKRIINLSYSFFFLYFIQIIYFLFEIAISLIQAYIFCLLLSLYRNDHSFHKI